MISIPDQDAIEQRQTLYWIENQLREVIDLLGSLMILIEERERREDHIRAV